MLLENWLNELTFSMRRNLLGKLVLRPGLPRVSFAVPRIQREEKYYQLVLSKAFSQTRLSDVQQVVDVGCRNWSYLNALADFFPKAALTGIEVDGGRRYWNLYRRLDFARAYVHELKLKKHREAQIFNLDFRELQSLTGDQDEGKKRGSSVFCFFFPFVSENPCLKWGLPLRFVSFKQLLEHSIKLSSKGPSLWISSHQGEWELELAHQAYKELGFQTKALTLEAEKFQGLWPSSIDTQIIVAEFPTAQV